jgi:hypothetical protein
MIEMMIERG